MNFDKNEKLEIFENAISWIVVFAMYVYGSLKPLQFRVAAPVDKFVSEMSGLHLMWAFYGYSIPYTVVLGVLEIVGGTLILFRKTRIIGCIFTSAILTNIILQDFFYTVPALKVAIFYQSILIIILWLNRMKIILGIKALIRQKPKEQTEPKQFTKLGAAFILFMILRIIEYYIT